MKDNKGLVINNRQINYKYDIVETFEAGIELKGTEVKSVKAFGKNFWTFYLIYRNGDDDSVKISTFVLQSEENESIQKATQLEGLLWLTGYAVS